MLFNQGDLNENQVKAWFANKRNRSNKQKNVEYKRKFSDSNASQEKIESAKKVKVPIIKKENESSETQNAYLKILSLINEPVLLDEDSNEYKLSEIKKAPQMAKKGTVILPKQPKYKKQCKIQPQPIIQPLLQPRPIVMQPVLEPYLDIHKNMRKKENKLQIAPGQAFNQYYQVRPSNNNNIDSQNFTQFNTEKNINPNTLQKLQTNDESYFQSLQRTSQQDLGQSMQQNRNLQLQLHQFQKQNELQHQIHHLQQKQK